MAGRKLRRLSDVHANKATRPQAEGAVDVEDRLLSTPQHGGPTTDVIDLCSDDEGQPLEQRMQQQPQQHATEQQRIMEAWRAASRWHSLSTASTPASQHKGIQHGTTPSPAGGGLWHHSSPLQQRQQQKQTNASYACAIQQHFVRQTPAGAGRAAGAAAGRIMSSNPAVQPVHTHETELGSSSGDSDAEDESIEEDEGIFLLLLIATNLHLTVSVCDSLKQARLIMHMWL